MLFFKSSLSDVKGSPATQAWRRFRRNPAAMAGLLWICLSTLVSFLGYLITPDSSPYANQQNLEIATSKPGFTVNMLSVRNNTIKPHQTIWEKLAYGIIPIYNQIPVQSWSFKNDTLYYEVFSGQEGYPGMEAFIPVWDVLYAMPHDQTPTHNPQPATHNPQPATLNPQPTTHNPQPSTRNQQPSTRNQQLSTPNQQPFTATDSLSILDIDGNMHIRSVAGMQADVAKHNIKKKKYLLGTDRFGRDLLSQLIIGMRVSLSVGFIAVFISLIIGITLGSIAGFFRGRADNFIVWLINVVWSIPTLLLVIAITFAIGKGFWQVFLAVGLTMWVEVARVVRGQTISLREKEYIEATRALGFSNLRIISKHILPNIMGPIIVISAANFASAILIEAGLSFLGIGVQPPMPSWGTMIRDHYGYIILDKGFLAVLPGMMIMLMVLAFMLVGNGLKEALDKTARS